MEASSSNPPQIKTPDDVLSKILEERMQNSNVNIGHYQPLIRAIKENDVKAQKDFLDQNPDAPMKSEIDDFGNTVFHLIVQQSFNSETVKLLKVLVSKVLVDSPTTLENVNVNHMTALDIAASAGNTQAVKVFVEKYKRLLSKEDEAVHHAAFWGRKETVKYLLSVTDWTEEFALDSGASLLKLLIESNFHDIALGLLKHYPRLALPEGNKSWNDIVCIPVIDSQDHIAWPPSDSKDGDLEMQNHKSSEKFPILPQRAATFEALGPKLYLVMSKLWDALIRLVPGIKSIHDQKLVHTQTLEIVRMMISEVNWNYKEASVRLKKPVLTAARLGIHEFVDVVLKAYQNSAFFCDEKRHNIFLLAVSYRKEKVFNLIHDQMALVRDYITKFEDGEGGNILHLAAKFVPSSQIPGSALQMQRELQWFKNLGLNGSIDPESFKACVPLVTHKDLEPYIQRIADGDTSPILTRKAITTISLRYWSHVVNCKSCHSAYKSLNALEVILQVISVVSVGIVAATRHSVIMSTTGRITVVSMAVVCFAASRWLARYIYKNFHYHDYNHTLH
ncbi:hypothetical protein EZV62_007093 [Acer yangbiense]|uniref:Uncharacterized protein n=1 Tax=Acer yangbiense TaxID=1000413 RepID=A0A5C7I9L2_9ROSI|nr:hypothetical protein EZV62_007093 [Acer yangbiense]